MYFHIFDGWKSEFKAKITNRGVHISESWSIMFIHFIKSFSNFYEFMKYVLFITQCILSLMKYQVQPTVAGKKSTRQQK